MSSSAPAAARSPPMRCGRCAAPASRRRSHLVETSPVLRAGAGRAGAAARWHDDLSTLPDERALARRRQRILRRAAGPPADATGQGWRERLVDRAGRRLRADGGPPVPDARFRPSRRAGGSILEVSPASLAIVAPARRIGSRAGRRRADRRLRPRPARRRRHAAGGVAAMLSPIRSTRPGERDLTAHVDFHALAAAARARGRSRASARRRRAPGSTRSGSSARRRARQGRAGAGRGDRGRARPADRARTRWGGCSRSWRWSRPAGPSRRASDMIAYRDASARRRARDRRPVRAQSFIETFGHLYDPKDLAAFLDRLHARRLARASSPIPTSPSASPRQDGDARRLCQARPGLAAGRRRRGRRSSCASSICCKPGTAAASRRR